jgi:hypothetical protein
MEPTFLCYASRCEKRPDRIELRHKLERHATISPTRIIRRALGELQRKRRRGTQVPWLRLATNGSLPKPRQTDQAFIDAFRDLVAYCAQANIPMHIPVESAEKAAFYRQALQGRVVVRQTVQNLEEFLNIATPAAFTGGHTRQTRLARLKTCETIARLRQQLSGRYCLVCPAITAMFKTGRPSEKAKCGRCKACSLKRFDIIYPQH